MSIAIQHRHRLAALALGLAACSSAGSNNDPPLRRQSDLITAEEIAATAATTAYAAVEALRPAFLRARSQSLSEMHFPVVYVNGQRWGDIESLRAIPALEVFTIRRLNSADAQSRYGPDHFGGVLDIVSKRGRGPSS